MLKDSSIGKTVQEFSGKLLKNFPLSPNQVTLLALLLAFAGFASLLTQQFALALVLFALSGFCDLADGVLARARNQVSAKGAFIDGITDRLVEFLLLFGLMPLPWPDFVLPGWMWLVALLFFGTCMTSFVTAYADHRKLDISKAPAGILSRPERMLMYLAILTFLVYGMAIWAVGTLVFATLLSVGTFCERTIYFVRNG
ncbi:MAG: CDP-alcohol phosphatidyltransferase family protein [Candidatus Micrarchaeota archaeon]